MDVGRATGAAEVQDDFVSKLSRIVQLTGTSMSVCILRQPARWGELKALWGDP